MMRLSPWLLPWSCGAAGCASSPRTCNVHRMSGRRRGQRVAAAAAAELAHVVPQALRQVVQGGAAMRPASTDDKAVPYFVGTLQSCHGRWCKVVSSSPRAFTRVYGRCAKQRQRAANARHKTPTVWERERARPRRRQTAELPNPKPPFPQSLAGMIDIGSQRGVLHEFSTPKNGGPCRQRGHTNRRAAPHRPPLIKQQHIIL